jgi:hypothetical protein
MGDFLSFLAPSGAVMGPASLSISGLTVWMIATVRASDLPILRCLPRLCSCGATVENYRAVRTM